MPKTRPPITRRRLSAADLRAELDGFEARYGVPSDQLADAFRHPVTGELVEAEDLHTWSQAFELWHQLTSP